MRDKFKGGGISNSGVGGVKLIFPDFETLKLYSELHFYSDLLCWSSSKVEF